jgi:hypothetical protein
LSSFEDSSAIGLYSWTGTSEVLPTFIGPTLLQSFRENSIFLFSLVKPAAVPPLIGLFVSSYLLISFISDSFGIWSMVLAFGI